MFLRASSRLRGAGGYCQNVNVRFLATQVEAAKAENFPANNKQNDYANAMPFSKIPGPSALGMISFMLLSGTLFKIDFMDALELLRRKYGDIIKFPGMFGKPPVVITCDPNHSQTVYRTEGPWPQRLSLETVQYYRQKVRPELFGKYQGLLHSEGKAWGDFRKAINPVMMHPQTTRCYIPAIDKVASDFLQRIYQIRNVNTNQLPANFEDELNKWTLESIGVIAMEIRFGLISDKCDERAARFIESVKTFLPLIFEIEMKPTLWKILPIPKFQKLMRVLDTMTELSSQYIDEAKVRIEKKTTNSALADEESVLEKLLKIDPMVAKVMAMDMVFAGVDTTSSAFVGLLYLIAKNPKKQELLRKEVLTVLPDKNSSFTIETMSRLPYLRACVKESQRILPTVNGNGRLTVQDLVLGGYQIPKGTAVVLNSSVLQKDDKHFPDAMKFIPERWIRASGVQGSCPASAKTAHPFIYLPFGFGSRMCAGRRFAEMEIEILIAKIIRNFYVSWEHPDLKFAWRTLNLPDAKLMFTLADVEK